MNLINTAQDYYNNLNKYFTTFQSNNVDLNKIYNDLYDPLDYTFQNFAQQYNYSIPDLTSYSNRIQSLDTTKIRQMIDEYYNNINKTSKTTQAKTNTSSTTTQTTAAPTQTTTAQSTSAVPTATVATTSKATAQSTTQSNQSTTPVVTQQTTTQPTIQAVTQNTKTVPAKKRETTPSRRLVKRNTTTQRVTKPVQKIKVTTFDTRNNNLDDSAYNNQTTWHLDYRNTPKSNWTGNNYIRKATRNSKTRSSIEFSNRMKNDNVFAQKVKENQKKADEINKRNKHIHAYVNKNGDLDWPGKVNPNYRKYNNGKL